MRKKTFFTHNQSVTNSVNSKILIFMFTMKNQLSAFFAFTLLLLALGFTACQKEDANLNEQAIITADNEGSGEDLFTDADDISDMYAETYLGSGKTSDECPTVTSSAPAGTFPNTITIDFGTECVSEGGRVRSGQIIITVTDSMHNVGATRTKTFVDYFVNGIQIEGTYTVVNNGPDENGNPSFTHTLTGGAMTMPDGTTATREATHTVTLIEGADTPGRWDNVLSVTGNSNGINKNGVAYSCVIIEPLIKRHNCRWIVSGVKEITRDGEVSTLDFGDGDCNRFAILTTPDGETHEIRLPK
ncbi:hypothetical protein C7N43_20685 [Sphingobacteriales bacterium UPWRP_1]|nr:hypothetical protein BVG80_01960 [Sphingobacteriales bacterium TSM_CSM]PSJ75124.1 hypothetical protein C7N43_20685 [Sphingobacteriales bacterium UPWRP_1]